MALFSECSLQCARKVLDTADIVREAICRQLGMLQSRQRLSNAPTASATGLNSGGSTRSKRYCLGNRPNDMQLRRDS